MLEKIDVVMTADVDGTLIEIFPLCINIKYCSILFVIYHMYIYVYHYFAWKCTQLITLR